MEKTLAIIGSREVSREKWIIATEIIWTYLDKRKNFITVISGGAFGIDGLGICIADHLGFETLDYVPTSKEIRGLGFNKYKPRNKRIAEDCQHMLCIRTQESESYGSGWTMEYAKGLGKEVEYHLL